ncbi:MAG: sigma-70 family RNA polymerase sigma factor [Candidatus Jacksonbacteria bacterium]|jgi:RNA polymerase sigma-70 factor, ECF subfamily|nr:sigma-70 family RNA polymerase sigma factor [Candidatus Jacksonbacteria bacterium]MBT6034691.1 sigma-70 family RNA polymerase sigma factor [Candidatus Jacksonbacteria bacterium]MBT6301164.1 sigma-70 family RNA polymerase sigma factor [Candidatus Jacksonbacteria bacterium]MBT6757264.1 sigma-70 family RNA polymerase sigma factor [Candidatus Jacksonbacteria bacterium]MBT6954772.1 sigma-70 family RNA polymerase sigma factor [Candidatus Jacksonbacteria bacterium]
MNKKACEGKTDEELVKLTLQDNQYFLCLMRNYEEKLMRYIKRISNASTEEAEDVLQEVYIKVYQNLNDFDTSLKFSSWIYRITRNEVISTFRKKSSRPQSFGGEAAEIILEKMASDLDTKKAVDTEYLQKNIYTILEKMDIKYKEVLVLRYLEEKDYNEISDILKKPVGTVSTLLNRAKKNFKKELDKHEITF